MKTEDMNVLITHERSGVVRESFKALGHNTWSCDLMPARDNSLYHRQCDANYMISRAERYTDSGAWDLIIMHPECTALTVAGNHVYAAGKPKHHERLAAIKYIDNLWKLAISCAHSVCLENPQGVIHTNLPHLPKPQYIQPYDFGEDASKKTGLTLYNLPPLKPTRRVPGRIINGVERWSNQTDSGQNKLGPSPARSELRSKTYRGIANAMAKQWSNLR